MAETPQIWKVSAAVILGFLLRGPAQADTSTALGNRSGEGSTPFTGLAQSPEANLLTGAMGTRVPINVPPGRKNVTPNLALEYSSTAGPSPYGFGWDLPLGHIQRSTKWGVPRCTGPHTNDFVLAMPGGTTELIAESPGSDFYRPKVQEAYVRAQKLATGNSNSWVVYDRSGLKYIFGDQAVARTGTDTSQFLHANADGSCAFTTSWALTHVEDPNGNAMDVTYANINNVPYPSSIDYGGNTAQGLAHFYHVRFLKPDGSLGYQERPDAIESYLSGARTVLRYRLTTITITTDIPTANTFIRSYTFSYDDPQNPPAGYQSRLSSVRTTGYPPTSFTYADSTTGLQAGPPQTLPSDVGSLRFTDKSGDVWKTVLDMDGDGFLDLVVVGNYLQTGGWTVYRGTANGWSSTPTIWVTPAGVDQIRNVNASADPCNANIWDSWSCTERDTFDINGDGIPDLVDAHTTPWTVYLGTVRNPPYNQYIGYFQGSMTWSAPLPFTRKDHVLQVHTAYSCPDPEQAGACGSETLTVQDVIDMNGDGLPDLVSAGSTTWQVYLNTGTGFSPDPLNIPAPFDRIRHSFNPWGGDVSTDLALTDFNGDGLPDLISAFLEGEGCPALDSDGDGVPELQSCWGVYYNSGQGFSSVPVIVRVPSWHDDQTETNITNCIAYGVANDFCVFLYAGEPVPIQASQDGATLFDLVDINGDGLPDYVEQDADNQWHVLLNVGGFFEMPPIHSLAGIEVYWSPVRVWPGAQGPIRKSTVDSSTSDQIDLIDVNGDGMLDRVDTTTAPWTVQLNANPVRPNLLVKVQNGLGGMTRVDYAPSTTDFENAGANSTQYLPFVTWVTTALLHEDGLCGDPGPEFTLPDGCLSSGHNLLERLAYAGGLFDPTEREFRGFHDVWRGDADSNWTHTVFLQDSTYKGRVDKVYTCAGDEHCTGNPATGQLVRAESNTWSSAPLAGTQSTQLWLQTHESWQYDLDPSAAYAVEGNDQPDPYGNILHTYRSGAGAALQVDTWVEYAQSSDSVVHDKPGHTWTIDYDGRRFGEKWFFYDDLSNGQLIQGNVTQVESWLDHSNAGSVSPCTVNASQQCVSTQTSYDPFGNVAAVTDGNGNLTSTTYDDGNRVFLHPYQVTDAGGHRTTTQTDYRWGKPSSVTDPNLAATSYSYDEAGRLQCVTRPSDPDNPDSNCSEQYLYTYATAPGQLSSVAVRRREPNQTAAYPSAGFPDQLAGYLTTTAFVDGLGRRRHAATMRVVGSVDYEVVGDWVTYDAVGRVASRADPYLSGSGDPANPSDANNGVTTYDYHLNGSGWNDPLGRVHTVTNVDGTTRTTFYHGAVRTDIDEELHGSTTTLDALGRVAHADVYDDSGNLYATTAYTYDGAGRVLTTVQNNNINTRISITYDSLGRKIGMVDPDSGAWSYGYDGVGNLVYENDPKLLQHMEFCYDVENRVTHKTSFDRDLYSGAGCTDAAQERYFYNEGPNGVGRLGHVIDSSGSTAFTYDPRGRVRSATKTITAANVSTAATTEFRYDVGDHLSQTIYPDGEVVTNTYDHSGQPVSLASSAASYVSGVQYDLFGRTTQLRHGNGVNDSRVYHGQPGSGQFPQGHRLQAILTQGPTHTAGLSIPNFARTAFATGGGGGSGPPTYLQLSYPSYTPRGLLAQITDAKFADGALSDSAAFTYDFLGRLSGASGPNLPYAYANNPTNGYHYDPLGNLTAKEGITYFYGDVAHPHQVNAVANNAISYDSNGNRTGKPGQTYSYDVEDRLNDINNGAVHFTYDYGGRRVAKVVVGSGVDHVTRYYSDLAEVADGILTKYYFLGGLRVASQRVAAPAGLAALPPNPAVQFAQVRPDQFAFVVLLRRDVQFGVATAAVLVTGGLLLAPWRRKRVVGVAVRHGHVVLVLLAFGMSAFPVPLVVRPVWATGGGGGAHPTPTPTPTPYPTATFGPPVEGGIYHYHVNHLGSAEVITAANGTVVEYIRYKPFGEVRGHYNADGTAQAVNTCVDDQYCYEFTGYESEPVSGLQYAGARFYDPALGMFLTHDPVRSAASPYGYCGGDPVNSTDPNGECPWCFFAIIAAVFVATAVDAGIRTGDVGAALKAGITSVPFTIAATQVGPGVFGMLVTAAPPAYQGLVAYALYAAGVGAGGYGTYQAAAHGYYATAGLGAVLTAFGAYQMMTGQVTYGAQPARPQGTNGGLSQEQQLAQANYDYDQQFSGIGGGGRIGPHQIMSVDVNQSGPFQMGDPLNGAGHVSQGFLGSGGQHGALDISAPQGTPVYSAGDGVVSYAGPGTGYGRYIDIQDANSALVTRYGHESAFAPGLGVGAGVQQGQLIGYVGNVGFSTGAHLHFEVIMYGDGGPTWVDPRPFLLGR